MSIAAICQRQIVSIDARASLREAAQLMRAHHVGALVVTQALQGREQAVGMLTDRDLALAALAEGRDPQGPVGPIASPLLSAIPQDADLAEAIARMREAGVRRLLVGGPQGQIVGFLSADDVLEALGAQLGGLAAALRAGPAREAVAAVPAAPPRPVYLAYGTPGMQQPVRG